MTTEGTHVGGHSYRLSREISLWLAITCILAAAIGYSWNPTPLHKLWRRSLLVAPYCMARFSAAFGLCLFFLSFLSRSRSLWRTWGPRQASPLDTTILKSAVVFLTSEAFQLLSVRCGSAQGISRGSLPRSCWTVPTGDSIDL